MVDSARLQSRIEAQERLGPVAGKKRDKLRGKVVEKQGGEREEAVDVEELLSDRGAEKGSWYGDDKVFTSDVCSINDFPRNFRKSEVRVKRICSRLLNLR